MAAAGASTPEVWGYFSVKGGGAIHEFSDSQFGHLFAKGESREAAVRAMVVALKEVKIRGEVRTIVDYATDLLQAREFWSNAHHTGWLDARIAAQVRSERPPWHLAGEWSLIAGTVLRAVEQIATRSKGQLPPSRISLVTLTEEFVVDGVKYRVRAVRTGPHSFTLHLGGTAGARRAPAGGRTGALWGGAPALCPLPLCPLPPLEEEAAGTRLNIGPRTCLLSNEHDPSSLLSMSTGKLVRYLVDDGGRVEADQPYAEVEVMKMVMTLLAPAAGVLRARLAEGAVLAPGLLIASLDLDDPGAVRRAELFTGSFPSLGPPLVASESVSHRFRAALEGARNILAGYHNPVDAVVAGLLSSLDDPALALQQWEEQFAAVQSRLPSALANQLESIVDGALASPAGGGHPLTPRQPRGFAQQLIAAMERAVEEAAPAERAPLSALLEPLMEVARAHCEGKEGFARRIASSLLEVHSSSLQSVLDLVLAHQSQELKSALLQRLLAALVLPAPQHYRRLLRRLAALSERGAAEVAASAQQLLEHSLLGELRAEGLALAAAPAASPAPEAGLVMRRMTVMEGLYAGLANVPPGGAAAAAAAAGVAGASLEARMSMLVEAPAAVEDALASLLMEHGGDPALQQRALSTYIRRLYHPHLLQSPELLAPPRPPAAAAGGEAAPAPAPLLLAAWAYDDPAASGTPYARGCLGAAAVVGALRELPAALGAVARLAADAGLGGLAPGTLHVVVVGEGEAALALTPEAAALARGGGGAAAGAGWPPHRRGPSAGGLHSRSSSFASDAEDGWHAGRGGAVDPALAAAAAGAQVAAASAALTAAGFEVVSVMTKRGQLAPLRNVYYRRPPAAAAGATAAAAGLPPLSPAAALGLGAGAPAGEGGAGAGAWTHDPVLCRLEPPLAAVLEVARLAPFGRVGHASSRNRQWHMFSAAERKDARSLALKRVFLRGVVRQLGRPPLLAATYTGNAAAAAAAAIEEVGDTLLAALQELERSSGGGGGGGEAAGGAAAGAAPPAGAGAARPDWAHVFLTVLPPLPLAAGGGEEARVAAALRSAAAALTAQHAGALRRAAVAQWEVRLRVPDKSGAWRVLVAAPTGHEAGEECVEVYREEPSGGRMVYRSRHLAAGQCGPADGQPLLCPYPPLEHLQQKRLAARRHRTTYAYDFPALFEDALRQTWAARAAAGEPGAVPPAGRLLEAQELVAAAGGGAGGGFGPSAFRRRIALAAVARPPAQNDVGVVAWVLTLRTPECPGGRQVVAIANDITFNSGAFGPAEDAMFRAATEYALEQKLPVVYLAANSGARVGLASEVKQCLRVEWQVPADPSKGVRYLYLSPADYRSLTSRSASTVLEASRLETEEGEERWVLTDVVGLEDGLGVECLSGSGAIAGVYARAFREGFTVTLVSGRTVGIGAYLARLGRRCVQRADQPIILTGYSALNKLLGREVYTSHMQLGGPKVMGTNGVSHHVVEDDLAGALCVLRWLSYTAPRVGDAPAPLPTADPVDRPVAYAPGEGEKMDPRAAIAGRRVGPGAEAPPSSTPPRPGAPPPSPPSPPPGAAGAAGWQAGLFDRGSWTEAQAGWARTVVAGRARLGGVAVGVVAVETATQTLSIPADPERHAAPPSTFRNYTGMPDSSERVIPQAGQVWFPDSALKTAQALEEFDLEGLPLFVLANWRGFSGGQRDLFEGVLQAGSLIVEALRAYRHPVIVYLAPGCELRGGAWVIEMYADGGAQGAVLEPQGVVEIKFRAPDLLAAMHRLDPVILGLKAEGGPGAEAAVRAREKALLPIYHQVALQFAQMHDGPVRMLAKGVIRGIVPWAQARAFLAARLRRRLAEEALLKHIAAADGSVARPAARALLRSWFLTSPLAAAAAGGGGSSDGEEGGGEGGAPRRAPRRAAPPGVLLAGARPGAEAEAAAERLWQDDGAFLDWVEGGSGAARVALELKALRTAAAAAAVGALSATAEGTDGLVRGLAAAVRANPSLLLQLRALLK
eukprot:scaffold1.g5434.t1